MSKFQIAIRKINIHFSKPIWSFIVNCVFWLGHLNKILEVKKMMGEVKGFPIDYVMGHFEWTPDSLQDWTQWPSTLVYNGFKGDCDDAAQIAKWHFKTREIKADILNLYNSKEGHTICVTKDKTRMVSNGNVVSLNPATWEQDAVKYFNNEYEVII